MVCPNCATSPPSTRSEEHTSELQSHHDLVCRLLLEKKNSLGASIGYVRPRSHRTLNVAWGPLEGGLRFAIIGYEWKWGTEAFLLLFFFNDTATTEIYTLSLHDALPIAASISPARAQQFGAESFTLANGLQVVVLPNHRAPAITQMVWYKTGGADDPRGKSGIAHFLEHLMFKGTAAHPPGEFSALISQSGVRNNAFTTEDYTVFHETVAKDHLDLVMQLEADRMTGLVLDDSVVLPERDVILEERRTRIDNDPTALLREQLEANLFLNASYRIPTIGWESEMRRLGTEDALAFYRQWYAPNNAILIVAGDADTAEVRRLAETNFGKLPARPLPARIRLDEPPHRAATRLEMKSARVAQPSLRRLYLAPSHRTGETTHAYALEVLAEILGGGTGSRLYEALVLKDAVALSASADYSATAIGLTTFAISATPKAGVAIAELEAAIDAQ